MAAAAAVDAVAVDVVAVDAVAVDAVALTPPNAPIYNGIPYRGTS